MTANFKFGGKAQMDRLLQLQPNKPIFVTEYWPGWFDHWFAPFHVILTVESFETILQVGIHLTSACIQHFIYWVRL